MILLAIDQFFGRFHPVFVHLPIGILLLAAAFDWLSRRERFRALKAALPITWGIGALAAVASTVTGYLLSLSGDYAPAAVNPHQWMGIAMTGLAIGAYLLTKASSDKPWIGKLRKGMPVLILIAVTITGHLGGNLTHGSQYLLEHMPAPFKQWLGGESPTEQPVITDVQQAQVYDDIVAPILADKCYSCHGAEKRKGELRLDQPEGLMASGESGERAVVAGQPEESELLERLLLPLEDEDHMPPKEKRQLTEAEIALLRWWIAEGATFDQPVKALEQPEVIAAHLEALERGELATEVEAGPLRQVTLPATEPGPPPRAAIRALQEAGIVVLPVEQNSNFLSISFISTPDPSLEDIRLLEPLAAQITWLKLSDTPLGDEALEAVGQLPNLTRLYLDHSEVTDRGLEHLTSLEHLAYLNLVGTAVTSEGVMQLKGLSALQEIYLYQVRINAEERRQLQEHMPDVHFEGGDYALPVLASDTTVVTKPPRSSE